MTETHAVLTQARLEEVSDTWNAGPFSRHYGFTLTLVKDEKVVIELARVGAAQRGGKGADAVNGATLSAMFDYAIGCTPILVAPDRRSSTVQLSIQFLRGTHGDAVRCEARIDRVTSVLVFATAFVYDSSGQMCAQCTGVCALGKPRTFEELKTTLMEKP